MSDERLENSKDKKTYFLRTQSSILRGEQNIPLNTLLSTYRNTTSVSKGKNKNSIQQRIMNHFMKGSKSVKTKNYISRKKNKNTNMFLNSFMNYGIIDLNKVSGSSHSSTRFSYKNNKCIIPDQSNEFSLYSKNMNSKRNDLNKTLNNYLTNNSINKYEHFDNHDKIKYNNTLNSPFYDLMRNIDKKEFNDTNKNNITDNINNIYPYHNNNLNNINQLYFKENNNNNNYFNDNPYEDLRESKESTMSKTMDLLSKTFRNKCKYNIKNEYKMYDSNNNNNNINNNFCVNNNYVTNNPKDTKLYKTFNNIRDFHRSFNSSYRNLKYHYLEDSKNNTNNMISRVKNIINNLSRSLKNTSRNPKIEAIGDKNNSYYLLNSRTFNIKSPSNNSKTKNLCNTERYNSIDKYYHSKDFLKGIFEQNLTNQFANDFKYFSPPKQTKTKNTTSLTNFDYYNNNEEKKNNYTPKDMPKDQLFGNKLEKMMKIIPRHKKNNYVFNYAQIKNKLINNGFLNKNPKLTYEEIDNIMPPTILLYSKKSYQ